MFCRVYVFRPSNSFILLFSYCRYGFFFRLFSSVCLRVLLIFLFLVLALYEGWNFNSGNYLFTTDTK